MKDLKEFIRHIWVEEKIVVILYGILFISLILELINISLDMISMRS